MFHLGALCSVVAKALCYNSKVAGSSPDKASEFSSICLMLPAALGLGVGSVSNRNEYQKQRNNVPGE
jgi:hypothetical protein